jgi:Ca-activated chloride channel family protein
MKHFLLTGLAASLMILAACSENESKREADAEPLAEISQTKVSEQVSPIPSPPVPMVTNDRAEVFAGQALRQSPQPLGLFMAKHQMAVMDTEVNREKYAHLPENGIFQVAQNPLSTFSIDVDTGSYTNVRRMLNEGQLPPADAVRVEEFINYFDYGSAVDEKAYTPDKPLQVITEVAPSPWNANNRLLRIELNAKPIAKADMKASNLVFLVDVSGSMRSSDKLELLKKSLKLLVKQMDAQDRISMVVYAGASGVALETTPGNEWLKIEQALSHLEAGGSTNGAGGIELAYQVARQAFIKGGNNRVILATDGDFNVGLVNHEALISLIERQRQQGIYLTTLGFGRGNYNDQLMEQLADKGNGNYAYIDSLLEAKKVLVNEIGSSLEVVARDVKLQVEFNPATVSEYRLIGYENRHLAKEDFNNDQVDAGDVGAGHSVMALYEITLKGSSGRVDPLRYADAVKTPPVKSGVSDELAFVKLRYKQPDESESQVYTYPIVGEHAIAHFEQSSDDFRFATAVAAFAQQLRGGKYLNGFDYDRIYALAASARGRDESGVRAHFLQLVDLTRNLTPKPNN